MKNKYLPMKYDWLPGDYEVTRAVSPLRPLREAGKISFDDIPYNRTQEQRLETANNTQEQRLRAAEAKSVHSDPAKYKNLSDNEKRSIVTDMVYRNPQYEMDQKYNAFQENYKVLNNTQRQISDMLTRSLAQNRKFKKLNYTTKPIDEKQKDLVLRGQYHKGTATVSTDPKVMESRNPLLTTNHELMHGSSALNSNTDAPPYSSMDDYLHDNVKGILGNNSSLELGKIALLGKLPPSFTEIIREAQRMIEPSGSYAESYPADRTALSEIATYHAMNKKEPGELGSFYSPDEANTHMLANLPYSIKSSAKQHANGLVQHVAQEMQNHFSKLPGVSANYEHHPLVNEGFSNIIHDMNQPYVAPIVGKSLPNPQQFSQQGQQQLPHQNQFQPYQPVIEQQQQQGYPVTFTGHLPQYAHGGHVTSSLLAERILPRKRQRSNNPVINYILGLQ